MYTALCKMGSIRVYHKLSIFLSKAHRSWYLYREGSASPLTAGWAPTRPLGPPLVPTIITAPKIRWSIVQPREWWLQGAPPSPASIWCNNKGLKPKRLSRGKLCQLVGFQVRSKTVHLLACLWLWSTKLCFCLKMIWLKGNLKKNEMKEWRNEEVTTMAKIWFTSSLYCVKEILN